MPKTCLNLSFVSARTAKFILEIHDEANLGQEYAQDELASDLLSRSKFVFQRGVRYHPSGVRNHEILITGLILLIIGYSDCFFVGCVCVRE